MVSVGVVIPTRDRPWNLLRCMRAIARTSRAGLTHVVIVDDAGRRPVDVGRLEHEIDCRIDVVRNDRRLGAARSRNLGSELIDASAIAFLDDDSEVFPDWFDVAREALDAGYDAATGRVEKIADDLLSRARQTRYERRYDGLRHGDKVTFLAGGNAIMRRDVFVATGGFPEMKSCSDNAIVARIGALGGACHFVPSLRVEHWHNHGWPVAIKEAWRAGRALPTPLSSVDAVRRVRAALDDPFADRSAAVANAWLEGVFLMGNRTGRRHVGADDVAEPTPVGR